MQKIILFFIFLFSFIKVAKGTDTILISENERQYFFGKQTKYLEDKSNQLTFSQLLSDNFSNQFKPLKGISYVSNTPNSGAVWFKFIIKNNSNKNQKLVLSFIKTDLYEADLYFIDKQNLNQHLKTGTSLPPHQRNFKSLSPSFLIELFSQETKVFYLRIYNVSFHHIFPTLTEEDHFESMLYDKFAFFGWFYGVVFFVFILNFILLLIQRKRKILYFLIYTFFTLLFTASIDGFLFIYFYPLIAWANGYHILVVSGMLVSFFWLFIKESLQIKSISIWVDKFIKISIFIGGIITILGLLEQAFGFWVGIYNLPVVFLLLCYISFLVLYHQIKDGALILTAVWFFFILGTFNILSLLNLFSLTDLTRWNFHISFLCEILVMNYLFLVDLRKNKLDFFENTEEAQSKIKKKNIDLEQKIVESNSELEAKTQQLESILESSPDYIYSFDENLNLLTANLMALERMKTYGYAFEIGQNFKNIFPDEVANFFQPLLEKTLKNAERINIETKGRKVGNAFAKYYSMTFNPIFSKERNKTVGVSLFIRDISNEMITKKKFTENEKLLLKIFDSAPDALFLIDKEPFSVQRYNQTAKQMFELEEIDIVEMLKNNIPLNKEKLNQVYQSIIKQKEWRDEIRYINRSGRNFWGEVKCSNFMIQSREFLLVRVTDIDSRKKAEEHINHLNRQMKSILENTGDTIFAIDNNYRYTIFNERHRKRMLYAYESQVKIGDDILEHVKNTPDADEFKKDIDRALAGEQFLVERRYGQGKIRNHVFEILYNPIQNQDNEIIGVGIFAREITEKKAQEAKIIQKEANLRAILENNDFAIWMMDNNLQLIDFNQSYFDFYKRFLKIEAKVGDNYLDYTLKPDFKEESLKRMEYILKGNIGNYIDEYLLNDKKYIFNIKGFPIYERNKMVGIACFSQNITQIKKNELMLKKKNKALKKVNTELDKFVYSASHDLRAPLSSILGLISLLNLEESEEQKQFYYGLMQKSIKKLDDFIQQIVHYSRNVRVAIQPEKIDLKDLIEYSIENLQYMPNSQKIKVIIENNITSEIVTDNFRLGVILNNLLSNAFRYADITKEQPFVKITANLNEKNIIIIIEDNGQGIDEKYLPRIFEMFYRATETNTGSGLGLYILKETLTILKGNIKVKSKYGVGTTFEVSIPNLI
ncbi:MAG: PAS domain S-box protein [Cytophagia bacterium]|nr:MAG: PAS domain S-box protein [Cytophagia bacterium]TAG43643.1 MAG: PAS domain S-box protein [Cytophagia bacterium]